MYMYIHPLSLSLSFSFNFPLPFSLLFPPSLCPSLYNSFSLTPSLPQTWGYFWEMGQSSVHSLS